MTLSRPRREGLLGDPSGGKGPTLVRWFRLYFYPHLPLSVPEDLPYFKLQSPDALRSMPIPFRSHMPFHTGDPRSYGSFDRSTTEYVECEDVPGVALDGLLGALSVVFCFVSAPDTPRLRTWCTAAHQHGR